MELNGTCSLALGKGTKKVKCYKFYCSKLHRDLALHEDLEHKHFSSVSDFITGFRMFCIETPVLKVKEVQINEKLDFFIKHFTMEGIEQEFERIEKVQENLKGKKK